MKSKIAVLLLACASTTFGALVSVESLQTFDGTGDTGFTFAGGVPLTSGIVSVGIFSSLSDTQVLDLANAMDLATLNGALTVLASDDFTGVSTAYGASIPGLVSMSVDGLSPTSSNTLYTLAVSGGAWALFKHNSTLTPDPAPPALPNTYGLNLSDGQILVGSVGQSYVADYSGIGGSATTTVSGSIQLIPEPSAALLGAIGAIGLLRRRRA